MKKLFLFLIITVSSFSSKADTLDFYHVFLNDSVIGKFNLHNVNDSSTVITFESNELATDDKLKIWYFRDYQIPDEMKWIEIIWESDKSEFKQVGGSTFEFQNLNLLDKGIYTIKYNALSERYNFKQGDILFYLKIE